MLIKDRNYYNFMIKKMLFSKEGVCDYCNRDTTLRYKAKLKSRELKLCTLCYEEQMEWQDG